MMTLTHANLVEATTANLVAYERALRLIQDSAARVRGIADDAASALTAAAAIDSLSDKLINAIVTDIKKDIISGTWLVADPVAAEQFFAAYKSKDKIAVRRALLLEWFSAECTEYTNLHAFVAKRDAETKAAKKSARAAKRQSIPTIPVVDTVGFPATVEGGGLTELTLSDGTTLVIPDDAIKTATIAAKPARAKREKKPTEPKPEKQPRDGYDGMQLAQLLIEVTKMFGHGTTMTNESALRYKLRRGAKMIAAGQKPVFSVSSPSKPSVRFSEERAKQLEVLLRKIESEGKLSNEHAVRAGIASAILGEMHDQLTKKSDDASTTAAAA